MTKEERLLWNCFLKKYPLQFHRQYVIGNYVADFYYHSAKLVVELDGSQHYTPEECAYDEKRTVFFIFDKAIKLVYLFSHASDSLGLLFASAKLSF